MPTTLAGDIHPFALPRYAPPPCHAAPAVAMLDDARDADASAT